MRVLIFANGFSGDPPELSNLVATAELIIAVDGGANHCADIGVQPHILIGDFDSISPKLLEMSERKGLEISRHPPRKDATDLELALDLAKTRGASQVWLVGVLGGRWDMSLANIMLTASAKYRDMAVTLLGGDCTMQVLHAGGMHLVDGRAGETVSLMPLLGDVTGVTLEGFEYPLHENNISFGSSLGLSNVLLMNQATVRHKRGVLLCVKQSL